MSLNAKRRTRAPRTAVASDGANLEATAEDRAHSRPVGFHASAPPADLVTSERLKGVRFDLAQPRGYYTEQVDTLVKLLTSSLAWHEEALYQRDQGIHALQTDLDVATQQEATLRAQVEVFRVQGSVEVGEDGQILRKSQVTAANDALAEAKGAAAAVDQRLAASIEEVRSLREWADIVIPQTAQISELARTAQEQLEVALQELAADREHSSELSAQVASLKSQVTSLESQVTSLESGQPGLLTGANGMAPPIPGSPEELAMLAVPVLATPAQAVDIEGAAPQYSAPQYSAPQDTIPQDSAPQGAIPAQAIPADTFEDPPFAAPPELAPEEFSDDERDKNLDDPELPVGVMLPRAKYDREYIAAHAGDPLLVDRRSPLEVWAPELYAYQQDAPTPESATEAAVSDDGWGAPLDVADDLTPGMVPIPIQQGAAMPTDVSDGVARPQLRRQV